MRKMLSILLGLLMVLPCGAATIQWYHQMPRSNTLADGMMIVFENQGSNGYSHTPLSTLRSYVGGTSSASPITNIYVNSNYVTVQFVTNNYVNVEYVNQSYTTNLTVVQTNYNNWNISTNSVVVNTNYNNWNISTNIEVIQNITVQSNLTVNQTITTKNLTVNSNFIVNGTSTLNDLTVTNGITNLALNASQFVATDANKRLTSTLNADPLTNSTGYSVAAMADTNWVLLQLESFGSINYFGGPTNTYAITNSTEGVSRTNVFTTSLVPFATASTSTVDTLVVGAYARHAVTTNKVAAINSGLVEITTYPFRTGGGGTVSGHYEFYAVDSVSNIAYELASSPTITIAATAPQQVIVSMTLTNDFLATNGAYAMIAFRVDSAGVGGPTLSWAHGGIYSAHLSFPRPLSSATIQASQIAGTITNTVATPGTVTTTSLLLYTNSWSGASNTLDMSKHWVRYITYTPCAVTGLTGKQSAGTAIQNTLLTITNAASTNVTLYYTGPVRTGDGARSWTITNATVAKLAVEYDPNGDTNVIFRLLY